VRVESPKAPTGLSVWTREGVSPSPLGSVLGRGRCPLPQKIFGTFVLKMARFGALWVLFMQTAVI